MGIFYRGGGKDFKDYLQNKYNEIDIETLTFILDNDDTIENIRIVSGSCRSRQAASACDKNAMQGFKS
jgi:hypothetical protein